jgi:hypothetical protein
MDIRVECVTPDGLSGKKRVWFRGIFHLIGILGESPFVSKLRKAESAQHRPAARDLRRALDRWESAAPTASIFLASSLYSSQAESTPAHLPCFANANRWAFETNGQR